MEAMLEMAGVHSLANADQPEESMTGLMSAGMRAFAEVRARPAGCERPP
jgi:hypothetical protein